MDLPARVLATIHKFALVPRGGRLVVAVSGGSDSVALLYLLRELERRAELAVAGIAHVNHGLRVAADDDEEFCRALARDLCIPFYAERRHVREIARELRTSIEDAGRRVRYEFFIRIASEVRADVVATGHTRDDQAETFLLRLIRGSGLRGLSAIRPKAGLVVRPLLEINRAELREWLAERGLTFREDETNTDTTFARNRVRHELIPFLQREFSPAVVDVLAREAAIAREDGERLEQEAIDLASSLVLVRERDDTGRLRSVDIPAADGVADWIAVAPRRQEREPGQVEIDVDGLMAAHPALASRVVRLALSILAPARFVGFEHVERLLALARQSERSSVSLPGQQATRTADKIVLGRTQCAPFSNSFRVPLSIPGEVVLEAQGWSVSAFCGEREAIETAQDTRWHPPGKSREFPGDPLTALVRADRPVLPLAVRSRLPGDRFRPFGLGGRGKKLQDFLVDRKVPREERDSLPLVVDSEDRIVWIVGHSVADDFRVTEPLQGVIFLKARRLGGLG
jgi:tRNA(Ile)-lysidine synthase